MTREFEKCFPLPWKIVRREVAYEQGYGETFYSLCLGDRVIPFVHLECGSRNNEEKALLVALEYLTTCANLMPEVERLVKHALDQEMQSCERCPNWPEDCGCCAHNTVVGDMKSFLAKIEGGGGDA